MKPSIDEQIEAVETAILLVRQPLAKRQMEAALSTLRWVKRYAPTIKTLKEQFPDAKFTDRSEDD
jgi:hypothetical protein